MKLFVVLCLLAGSSAFVHQKRDTAALIKDKFEDFREGCFPRGSGKGCSCTTKSNDGSEVVNTFSDDSECKKSVEETQAENKKKLNEEFNQKFGSLKENCFPAPSGGCRCTEKDSEGNEVTKKYNTKEECNVPARVKRGQVLSSAGRDQNVRDPVREKAQQNYAAVIQELKDKFRNNREGCFPRPKGCLCVTGKDSLGHDITTRYMKDEDCKCKPGEPGCPAAAGA
ncbi:hypothetical protein FO519_006780 [Halicephalobus sp. NKZ332]|nr:hypothetical protein FO519_006780 [Halicephalobus sp. NKZ332]